MNDDKIIQEVFNICKDLDIQISTGIPDDKNKYLSAWNKGTRTPTPVPTPPPGGETPIPTPEITESPETLISNINDIEEYPEFITDEE